MGSGAEIGVYLNAWDNENDFSIVSITLPMTLELYYCDYYGACNIFNWHPTEEQWWITGFSPDYMNPNINDLFMIASVDLSKDARMYETLKKFSEDNNCDYLIFDDDCNTVWFEWYETENKW